MASGRAGMKVNAWIKPRMKRPIKIRNSYLGSPNIGEGPSNMNATAVIKKQITNYSLRGQFLRRNGSEMAAKK